MPDFDDILEDDNFPGETAEDANIDTNVDEDDGVMPDPPEVAEVEDGSDVEEPDGPPPQEDQTPESPVEPTADVDRSDEPSEPVETPPAAQEEPESGILADAEPAPEPDPVVEPPSVGDSTPLGDIEVPVPLETRPPQELPPIGQEGFAPVGDHGDLTGPGAVTVRTLEVGEQVSVEVAQYWDIMMAQISQDTRMKIWETGIMDVQTLLSTPSQNLVKPRGPLTQAMVDEVNAWFAPRGLKMADKPVRAARQALPAVTAGGGEKLATRKMTSGLADSRKEWIKGMKGGR